ncbi:MAG: hypothetical protein ACOCZX_00125 [Candidatus Bipolaricaulota bacterium]
MTGSGSPAAFTRRGQLQLPGLSEIDIAEAVRVTPPPTRAVSSAVPAFDRELGEGIFFDRLLFLGYH